MRGGFSMERALVALALAGLGGCAAAGTSTRPAAGTAVAPERDSTPEQVATGHWRRIQDSVTAQAIADQRGPGVSIHATYRTAGPMRRVQAAFTMADAAYVLVAHVDADGRLTVLFPKNPQDDGYVEGGRYYQTPEVDAGFQSNYAYARSSGNVRYRPYSSRVDSYDGGTGYLFVVASWRPMKFDRISDNGRWARYELSDEFSTADPRDEVEEFAALIAGDSREAYSVQYATYYRSNYTADLGSYGFDSYNSYDCSGYSAYADYYGLGYPSWGFPSVYGASAGWYYLPISDPVSGCRSYSLAYIPTTFTNGYVNWPVTRTDSVRRRMRPGGLRDSNVVVATGGGSATNTLRMMRATELGPLDATLVQPDYRSRGLITPLDPRHPRGPEIGGTGRKEPSLRIDQARPGIADMVIRGRDRGDAGVRQPRGEPRIHESSPSGMPVMREPANVSRSPRVENSGGSRTSPVYSAPHSESRSEPRAASPRTSEPASAPRMQAPPPPPPPPATSSSPREAPAKPRP